MEEQFHSQPSAVLRPSWIVALVAVVAVVALIFVYLAHRTGLLNKDKPVPPTQTLQVDRTDLAATQVPDKFPQELVTLEKGATVTENYNAMAAGDRFQATRSYETDKALSEIVQTYRNFFSINGWTISATLDQEQQKVIVAGKGVTKVVMSAEENAVTHIRTVSVSASILKAPVAPTSVPPAQ